MIREGSLGEVSFATSDHHHPLVPSAPKDQWRMRRSLAGSGSFTDIGIYSLNGLLWFMGEPLAALSARTWGPPSEAHFAEVEAVASVQLRFRSGRLANISSGYLGDKKRIEVFGSDAVATLDAATEYMSNRLMVRREEGTEEARSEFGSPVQFDSEIDHLSRCILEDRDVLTLGGMGLRDCRLIEAVHRSAEAGGLGWSATRMAR